MSKTPKLIAIALIGATIRRDAMTINTVMLPAYELTIARKMFGAENVNPNGESAVRPDVDPATEVQRLIQKYGPQKIEKIFGDDNGERLVELIERSAVTGAAARVSTPPSLVIPGAEPGVDEQADAVAAAAQAAQATRDAAKPAAKPAAKTPAKPVAKVAAKTTAVKGMPEKSAP